MSFRGRQGEGRKEQGRVRRQPGTLLALVKGWILDIVCLKLNNEINYDFIYLTLIQLNVF